MSGIGRKGYHSKTLYIKFRKNKQLYLTNTNMNYLKKSDKLGS